MVSSVFEDFTWAPCIKSETFDSVEVDELHVVFT